MQDLFVLLSMVMFLTSLETDVRNKIKRAHKDGDDDDNNANALVGGTFDVVATMFNFFRRTILI